MEKNEIVINGVHHVLVEDGLSECIDCSLLEICTNSRESVHDVLCSTVFGENGIDKHFEVKNKTMSKEEFNIVVKVMSLLRSGKISTLTPNCEVREILLAEKIEHK